MCLGNWFILVFFFTEKKMFTGLSNEIQTLVCLLCADTLCFSSHSLFSSLATPEITLSEQIEEIEIISSIYFFLHERENTRWLNSQPHVLSLII